MRYALLVAYDGSAYGGWQIQKNAVTVQEKLSYALEQTFGRRINIIASGRTDSGVHAAGQVCHFDAETNIPAERIADALNFRLPEDISVLKSVEAPFGFDCSKSVKKKTYCYRIYLSPVRIPLLDRYCVQVNYPVNIEKLATAGKMFTGEHDFKAYCAAGSNVKTTVRTIYSVEIAKDPVPYCDCVKISVTGNGFLYNMVRTLAGTMLGYASGRIPEDRIIRSLKICDRNSVGKTMPARGLTLESVDYGFKLF